MTCRFSGPQKGHGNDGWDGFPSAGESHPKQRHLTQRRKVRKEMHAKKTPEMGECQQHLHPIRKDKAAKEIFAKRKVSRRSSYGQQSHVIRASPFSPSFPWPLGTTCDGRQAIRILIGSAKDRRACASSQLSCISAFPLLPLLAPVKLPFPVSIFDVVLAQNDAERTKGMEQGQAEETEKSQRQGRKRSWTGAFLLAFSSRWLDTARRRGGGFSPPSPIRLHADGDPHAYAFRSLE